MSKHLRVLRDADLVIVRTDAQRRWYRANPQPGRHGDRSLLSAGWKPVHGHHVAAFGPQASTSGPPL